MSSLRGQFSAKVTANIPLCREHFKLLLYLPEFPQSHPGQFVQLACDDPIELPAERNWTDAELPRVAGTEIVQREAFLRRPFSLAGRRDLDNGVELSIIHRIVGVGTGWMSRLRVGQNLSLIGPLGNYFRPPAKNQTALLVGGGVGIPPMLYWADQLRGKRAIAFCGALSRDLIPLTIVGQSAGSEPAMIIREFADYGIPSVITTDDGSIGIRGFVTQALESYLDSLGDSVSAVIYTCGPEPMMRRVADIALARNIECQVAVERAMACGMGTCQSCVIRVRKPDPARPPLPGSDWCYRLACTDGTIFRASELLW
ncbi:MAG TPA: dihydroorotate dehydrogenase electron transfer subunit [Tepidisphaeraceae bacterium]|nr:dihydroorotate dehydrogenase electron transfer subunit [Tepidisphaeraceae bacterium]